MEPRSRKQGASRTREAQSEIEEQEKDDRKGQAKAEDNVQGDEEEVDPGSLSFGVAASVCEHSRPTG